MLPKVFAQYTYPAADEEPAGEQDLGDVTLDISGDPVDVEGDGAYDSSYYDNQSE